MNNCIRIAPLLFLFLLIGKLAHSQILPADQPPTNPPPLIIKHYHFPDDKPRKPEVYQVDKYTPGGKMFRSEFYREGILDQVHTFRYNPQGDEVSRLTTSSAGDTLFEITTEHFYNGEGKRIRSLRQDRSGTLELRVNYQADGGWTERRYRGGYKQGSTGYDRHGRVISESYINHGIMYARDDHGEVTYIREQYEEGHNVTHVENEYNQNGKLLKTRANDRLVKECKYDAEGRRIELKYYSLGRVSGLVTYIYQ